MHQPYQGSHLRAGKAYARIGRFSDAFEHFQVAANMSSEPLYQIEFAKFLILYGSEKEHFQSAIDKLNTLLSSRGITNNQKAFITYMRSNAEAKLGQSIPSILETLELGLSFDKSSSFIEYTKEEIEIMQNLTQSYKE